MYTNVLPCKFYVLFSNCPQSSSWMQRNTIFCVHFFEGAVDSGYLQSVPQSAAVGALNCLRQLMQDALQKSTSRKTWEQPNGTVVQGPLSWKQLHHLATKGQLLYKCCPQKSNIKVHNYSLNCSTYISCGS